MTDITWAHDRYLDVRGLACPLPVLKARKALLVLPTGKRLLVEATDPLAAIDIPNFCRESGDLLVATATRDEVHAFLIERGEGRRPLPAPVPDPTRR